MGSMPHRPCASAGQHRLPVWLAVLVRTTWARDNLQDCVSCCPCCMPSPARVRPAGAQGNVCSHVSFARKTPLPPHLPPQPTPAPCACRQSRTHPRGRRRVCIRAGGHVRCRMRSETRPQFDTDSMIESLANIYTAIGIAGSTNSRQIRITD